MALKIFMNTSTSYICQAQNGVAAVQPSCPAAHIWRNRLIVFARTALAYGLAATHAIFPS